MKESYKKGDDTCMKHRFFMRSLRTERMEHNAPIYYERKTKETVREQVYKDNSMRFLYNTALGGVCVLFLRLPVVSRIYGLFQKSKRSRTKIEKLIDAYGIQTSGAEYINSSFNDFIIRRRLRTDFDTDRNHLIAPADSCLLAYTIDKDVILSVKDKRYTLSRFLKDSDLAREYEGGTFLVFRLRVYDYHRFCFVDDGVIISHKCIRGFLDSVNKNATGRFTLSSNYREISLLRTVNFGIAVFAEIGAMLVGRIVQTRHMTKRPVSPQNAGEKTNYLSASPSTPGTTAFHKGDEKGYFEFGGSSIVLLFKKDVVKIDDDIWAYSAKGIETKVSYGEKIGEKRA